MKCSAFLAKPAISEAVDPLCFEVRGWFSADPNLARVTSVEAWSSEVLLGQTFGFQVVREPEWNLQQLNAKSSFRLFAHHPAAPTNFELQIRLRLADGTRSDPVFSCGLKTIGADYRDADFGIMLRKETVAIQRRQSIYTSGPSVLGGSGEVLDALRTYIGSPKRRILDVGCGLGFYGRELLKSGFNWFGVEVKQEDCDELAKAGLPHKRVDGTALPFEDGAFDVAMCIEVLEHIEEPHAFLREIRRVAPEQIIISVPNCELLSYLSKHLAVPWHLLEADHKSFFTRWSLEALLKQYYPHVEVGFHREHPLRSKENTPLYYHLLAVGRSTI